MRTRSRLLESSPVQPRRDSISISSGSSSEHDSISSSSSSSTEMSKYYRLVDEANSGFLLNHPDSKVKIDLYDEDVSFWLHLDLTVPTDGYLTLWLLMNVDDSPDAISWHQFVSEN